MWDTLRNAWKVEDIRRKLLYTFFMLIVFRLVGMIPAPGINADMLKSTVAQYDALNILDMMTGNAFQQMTVMAMGITPYINASIIIQLLTIAIPSLERLAKEGGEEGKEKINKITRYSTVVLAALQVIGLLAALRSGGTQVLTAEYNNFFGLLSIGVVMAGGTALSMWIGERITANGIGNGISLLIFAGIISNLFNGVALAFGRVLGIAQGSSTALDLIIMVISLLAVVTAVTFVDMGERRVPIQYAKRVVGRKMYGGQNTHIPIKVMSVGVLPLIFANSFMAFIGTAITIIGGTRSGLGQWWQHNMHQTAPLNLIITSLLIIMFTYFYSSISFNPGDIAKNINQQGGTIPGIRAGRNTTDFLARTTRRLTLFAGLFLAVLSSLPALLKIWQGLQIPFAASSMLICVSVALETLRQLEAQLVMRNYEGFL